METMDKSILRAYRYADEEIYTTLGRLYEENGEMDSACDFGYVPCFRLAFSKKGNRVFEQGQGAARALFVLKRWDDCARILDLCVQRGLEVGDKGEDMNQLLSHFGALLCLHLRDFRKCADLYIKVWNMGRTGDAKADARPINMPAYKKLFKVYQKV